MARLVADLLTLARLDAGDAPLEHETLDLASMLPTWVNRFQRQAEQANVSLQFVLDSPPPVQGDPERLEQAVANLIDNAIKYNHSGGSIMVSAGGVRRAESSSHTSVRRGAGATREWAVIRVSDTGQGIPSKHVPRLFERFYRADQARAAGGSGLGLSIVQEIVNAHHGEVEVQSQEGKGTTFSIWLPSK